MSTSKVKLFFFILIIEMAVLSLGIVPLLFPHPEKPWSNREFWILLVHDRKLEFGLISLAFLSITWYLSDRFQKN